MRLETKRLMAKGGYRDVGRLKNWDVMAPLLLETANSHRAQQTLPRNLDETESVAAGKTS